MKKTLKIILICVLCAALLSGGLFAYLKLRKKTPCTVYPAAQWLMSYLPNQTYLYGIVTSDASQVITNDPDLTVLEVLVQPGDAVSIGDRLLRYDATRTQLEFEQKKLDLEKLENRLRASYKEYRKYAYRDYEEPLLTPTPSPSPRIKTGALNTRSLGAVRLSTRLWFDLVTPVSGDGSQSNPYIYEIGANDPVTNAFLQSLLTEAADKGAAVFAEITQPETRISVQATPAGELSLAIEVDGETAKADLTSPKGGNGTASDPLRFDYGSGATIPASFLATQWQNAQENMRDWYVTLSGVRLTVGMVFSPDGALNFYTSVQKPTPTPTSAPTPKPTEKPTEKPTQTPSASPTAPVESFEPEPPHGGGMSRAEREAYIRELATSIREDEVQYRQLVLDLEKAERKGLEGYLLSEVNGTVMTVASPDEAGAGETLVEVRGGSGLHISVMLGEDDLQKYPVGTELNGFSYESGSTITARVSRIGTMPVSTRYSNGGNPNSSGYLAVLDVVGDVSPKVGEYIEFSGFSSLYDQGRIYLHEAFLREIDGESCVFVVHDDVLEKLPVCTGDRMNNYVELPDAPITPEDRIAFPYDKNCKEGNPVEDAQNDYYFGYGW